MKVWISKYCLTQGIYETDVEDFYDNDDMVLHVKENVPKQYQTVKYYQGRNKNWHTTKESAIERAEIVRNKKIESLKRQIVNLELLKFE